jgi:hypothetical protein
MPMRPIWTTWGPKSVIEPMLEKYMENVVSILIQMPWWWAFTIIGLLVVVLCGRYANASRQLPIPSVIIVLLPDSMAPRQRQTVWPGCRHFELVQFDRGHAHGHHVVYLCGDQGVDHVALESVFGGPSPVPTIFKLCACLTELIQYKTKQNNATIFSLAPSAHVFSQSIFKYSESCNSTSTYCRGH